MEDANKIDASLLASWQKSSPFVLSKVSFFLRGLAIAKISLNRVNCMIIVMLQRWLDQPKRTPSDILGDLQCRED